MLIEWNESFNLGNVQMDSQHHIFLNLINKLNDSFHNGDYQLSNRIYDELYKFAQFRFISEENLMQDIAYPGYERHKKTHDEILGVLRTYYQQCRDNKLEKSEFIQFLFDWFVVHTTSEDKKICDFQQNK